MSVSRAPGERCQDRLRPPLGQTEGVWGGVPAASTFSLPRWRLTRPLIPDAHSSTSPWCSPPESRWWVGEEELLAGECVRDSLRGTPA